MIADFSGRLPKTMEEMLTLPGVARKTANVVLGTLFQGYEGIVVDTHMIRFARRFDLSDFKDAVRIERDLMGNHTKKRVVQFPPTSSLTTVVFTATLVAKKSSTNKTPSYQYTQEQKTTGHKNMVTKDW